MNSKPLLAVLNNKSQFTWIVKAAVSDQIVTDSVINYYNPARGSHVQVIGPEELDYLQRLSSQDQIDQLNALADKHVKYIIFDCDTVPVNTFSQQDRIAILKSTYPAQRLLLLLGETLSALSNRSSIFQGSLVVVNNQGILIRGKSGAGKSQLIIKLLDRGHLWVSDELTHCFLNVAGQLTGKALDELSEFAHVKHIGPVNLDKTYGLSRRLKQSTIAAIVHLGENNNSSQQRLPAYSQQNTEHLLGCALPVWHLSSEDSSSEALIELCARQLILSAWESDASIELETALAEQLDETH